MRAPAHEVPRIGGDNPYAAWQPFAHRPPLSWPHGARLAFAVVVCVEHLELFPDPAFRPAPSAIRYGPYPGAFQISRVSDTAYGGRVGAFRLLETISRVGMRPMVAMDSQLFEDHTRLVEVSQQVGAEFLAHGPALSRYINESLEPATEAEWIERSIATVAAATTTAPTGWLGAEYGESTRTPAFLRQHGIRYVCDWANDEQPYDLQLGSDQLTAVPVAVDLDDVMVGKVRQLPPWRWADLVKRAVSQLWSDGAATGRLLVLCLHAHVSGQPFRIKYVADVLETVASLPDVWLATGGEIDQWHRSRRSEP
jgi:allantoinase